MTVDETERVEVTFKTYMYKWINHLNRKKLFVCMIYNSIRMIIILVIIIYNIRILFFNWF